MSISFIFSLMPRLILVDECSIIFLFHFPNYIRKAILLIDHQSFVGQQKTITNTSLKTYFIGSFVRWIRCVYIRSFSSSLAPFLSNLVQLRMHMHTYIKPTSSSFYISFRIIQSIHCCDSAGYWLWSRYHRMDINVFI